MKFQRVNNITGWVAFGIVLVIYWICMEPTASFWDCGEFIAVSYKLEVPHPPGAPFFLLIGRLFSFLAGGDVTKVAPCINFASNLSGAFTVLFTFWSITLFGRKLLKLGKETPNTGQTILLMGAGLVGSLACAFCDSIWFSAEEAEVYAMSSFFTAFVVWAMLKWDRIEDEAKANRWLILLFYMIGLSIGVHLLNLVTLPALSLVYYFKKYKPSTWGIIFTLILSLLIIFFINEMIIPGLPAVAGDFEIFFVNTLGLPFGSGVIVFGAIILTGIILGIRYSHLRNRPVLNTFLLSVAFILIGYSSYAMVVIRSSYDPPIDEDDPSDVMTFVSYLLREQYGSRPLLYGQYFTAERTGYSEGAPVYKKGKDRYVIKDRRIDYTYDPKDETIFPRIYSTDPEHQQRYREILGLKPGEKPDFIDNIRYMFTQQIGHMYVRYFFFNFAGRESDEQDADWIGPSQWFEHLPQSLAENKAHNNFFMIPFVLGLIGLYYQSVHDQRNMAAVGLLFVLTGVALVVYLNTPPSEPRERDYIYAGSYYAYSFWIGLSVIALGNWLAPLFKKSLKYSAIVATVIGLSAPALMAAVGWNDHDRSNRYFSADSAKDYLYSCAPNAVLFTGGDNDTFPLWYCQETEGIRTDMRVVVLSYYNTDWYIGQTMRQAYQSAPLPYTLSLEQYREGGPNDVLPYEDLGIKSVDLRQYISLLSKDYKGLRLYPTSNVVPTKVFTLNVDVDKVRKMGIVPASLDSLIVPQMVLRVKGNYLEKKDLAFLDLLATTDWSRPLYVNNTSLSQFSFDLRPYIVQEGVAYRVLPVLNPHPNDELLNTKVCYDNMFNRFSYRQLDNPNVYYTPDYKGSILTVRSAFNSLAETLIDQGKTDSARSALLFSLEKMPDKSLPYDYTSSRSIPLLFEVGEKDKAVDVARKMGKRAEDLADYYIDNQDFGRDLQIQVVILGELQSTLYKYGESDLAKQFEDAYKKYSILFEGH